GARTLAELGQRRVARVLLPLDVLALDQAVLEALAALLLVEGRRAARLHLLHRLGELVPGLLDRVHGLGEAERVPRLERTELPVVAPPHRVIDRGHGVGDLAALPAAALGRDPPRRVGEAAVEDLAREVARLALVGDDLAHALARILDLRDRLRRRL